MKPRQAKQHRFIRVPDGNARKRKHGGKKAIRRGARNPGSTQHGSVRRPF